MEKMEKEKTHSDIWAFEKIQKAYDEIAAVISRCLSEKNQFHVEFKGEPRTQNSHDFTIFRHPCRMTFSGIIRDEKQYGRLVFEKIISDKESSHLVTMYFDKGGLTSEAMPIKTDAWDIYSLIAEEYIRGDFCLRLCQAFFKSMTK